jgi:hypothetical protein
MSKITAEIAMAFWKGPLLCLACANDRVSPAAAHDRPGRRRLQRLLATSGCQRFVMADCTIWMIDTSVWQGLVAALLPQLS